MQQVTNLLKELKNNSSAAGYNTSTNNNNTGIAHQPNDEKSLKLQDLEKTTSNNHNNNNSEFIDKLRAENTQLRRRVEQLERDFDLQRGDLANQIKQKQSKADLAAYYQQHSKEQAGNLCRLEQRLENASQDLMELTQENERLRGERRQVTEKLRAHVDEKEQLLQKLAAYKINLKMKDQHIKELIEDIDDKMRVILGLEEQTGKLVAALKKQKNHEEKLLSDHFSHLQQQNQALMSENQTLKKQIFKQGSSQSKSSNVIPAYPILQQPTSIEASMRSKSPIVLVPSAEDTALINALLKELHSENQADILPKVRDLKLANKKHLKEKKLVLNLQKLVKDCEGLLPHDHTAATANTKSHATLNTEIKTNRTTTLHQ